MFPAQATNFEETDTRHEAFPKKHLNFSGTFPKQIQDKSVNIYLSSFTSTKTQIEGHSDIEVKRLLSLQIQELLISLFNLKVRLIEQILDILTESDCKQCVGVLHYISADDD